MVVSDNNLGARGHRLLATRQELTDRRQLMMAQPH